MRRELVWGAMQSSLGAGWTVGRGGVFCLSKYPHVFLAHLCGAQLRSTLDNPSRGFSSAADGLHPTSPQTSLPLPRAAALNLG